MDEREVTLKRQLIKVIHDGTIPIQDLENVSAADAGIGRAFNRQQPD